MQKSLVGHEMVCSWLGLPADCWPPDHYTLLGLTPGEPDIGRIEEHVHERLMRLRPYQLNHPDHVTEAMNRLARAFSCLTDPDAKQAYDDALLGRTSKKNEIPFPPEPGADSVDPLAWLFGPWSRLAAQDSGILVTQQASLDWMRTPPPQRHSWAPPPVRFPTSPAAPAEGTRAPDGASTASPPPLPAPAVARPPLAERVPRAWLARRGLGTKSGLFSRIDTTRHLLRAWRRVGRYVAQAERRLTRAADAVDLIRQLHRVRKHLKRFPPLLGDVGQPGFWVLSLARQQMAIPIFRALSLGQREMLARDWKDGLAVLASHRRLLRHECRCVRGKSCWGRLHRSLQFLFAEHPSLWLVVALALAFTATAVIIWLLSTPF
jgi:hypothetical protein